MTDTRQDSASKAVNTLPSELLPLTTSSMTQGHSLHFVRPWLAVEESALLDSRVSHFLGRLVYSI